MKRLNDSSDVSVARLGILLKNIYKLKEKDRAAFFFPERNGTPGCVNKRAGGKKVCS